MRGKFSRRIPKQSEPRVVEESIVDELVLLLLLIRLSSLLLPFHPRTLPYHVVFLFIIAPKVQVRHILRLSLKTERVGLRRRMRREEVGSGSLSSFQLRLWESENDIEKVKMVEQHTISLLHSPNPSKYASLSVLLVPKTIKFATVSSSPSLFRLHPDRQFPFF